MSIKALLYYHLSNDSNVTALISNRIYTDGYAPQSASRPYITVNKLFNDHFYLLTGADVNVDNPTVQIDVWADSQSEADGVYQAVKSSLGGFAGTVSGVEIMSCNLTNDFNGLDFTEGSQPSYYRETMEFKILHRT